MKVRPNQAPSTKKAAKSSSGKPRPRAIAYSLPHEVEGQTKPEALKRGSYDLHILPLGSREPLADCECVLLFAGCFEILVQQHGQLHLVPSTRSDVDRRDREVYTLLEQDIPVIFLIPARTEEMHIARVKDDADLFTRILPQWRIKQESLPHGKTSYHRALVPEFTEYVERYCVADSALRSRLDSDITTLIAGTRECPVAREIDRRLFLLPCYYPKNRSQAIEMATAAISAVLAYRARLSKKLPPWTDDFRFAKEETLRKLISDCQHELATLEADLQPYTERKGLLSYQSEPLVEIVTELLQSVFGLNITAEDEKIEDANVVDEQGNRLAVIEIKGITGSFQRKQINQVDDHRERLGVEHLPGIVILNNKRNATSLAEKDEAPKADIIQKAKADHVLLIRTLDLLRFADLIDQGKKTQDDFREIILNQSGWLCVEGDDVSVRTE